MITYSIISADYDFILWIWKFYVKLIFRFIHRSISSVCLHFFNYWICVFTFPGRPQPVNFDFHRQDTLRRDPTIVQPVAVRLSPDSPVLQSSDLDEDEDAHRGRRKVSRGEVGYEKLWNAAGREDNDDELEDKSHPG